ncbi:type I secretion system permease/ATPase [Burkholderia ubonensis]|uniref:type I secretion system permease/ATPase n=1 Tax=Burkholderia ubonensis TaxID=101571 RepID=UPI0022B766F2|nr:type I secretion system permease/ATPase [Burkholderia ubonensis]
MSHTESLSALCVLARLHNIAADPDILLHELGLSRNAPVSDEQLLLASRRLGLKAKIKVTQAERLSFAPLPALARIGDADRSIDASGGDAQYRWVVLSQCDGQRVVFLDPDVEGRPVAEHLGIFIERWAPSGSGELLLATSAASQATTLGRFDFTWFIPSIVKYRRFLAEVLTVSVFLQLFALVSPLFFQVVTDKVIAHHGLTTLDVMVTGLVMVVVFESLLSGLCAYVFSHTTSRIDVELGARLFRHLLQLPLAYFQARRVGDSVARVRELENIRSFLTGRSLTLVLDVAFSVLFIGVMLLYSVPLTLIVLISLPLYAVLVLGVVPVLRRRLDEKFSRGAESQSLVVETITGIQTVKASALEPTIALRWENQLAGYVAASFKTQNLSAWAHEGINLIGKLVNAATMWFGARLVMEHELSVGQFVAFNMFAGHVAQPIMRLSQVWTDFQQTGISMQRLGDILNSPTEVPPSTPAPLPPIKGHITLDDVTFRYRREAAPVLHGVSLDVSPGAVLGIVGRSGSGKSTLTKLVQRLYIPEQGRVLIDGIDISLVDAGQLRRQIGVVLQDSFLFNRSVRENIAIADPGAPIEWAMHVARMAGAHDFICELPEGYNTVVGEQGMSLSGGQRQRLAIARALFTDPRVLIFDEATSALDYESEAVIQRNMAAIAQDRTVIIIAHRLSAVRHADYIIAMEKGQIVEGGSHDELVQVPDGLYAYLWSMQQNSHPLELRA